MIHYFLCREQCDFLRIGAEGDKETMQDHFEHGKKANGLPLYDAVEYIGAFVDVIYTDVDTDVGVGNRRIPGGFIRTAKYIYQLRTKREAGDYWEYLRNYHKGLAVSVKGAFSRKEEIRKRKEAKSNAGNQ